MSTLVEPVEDVVFCPHCGHLEPYLRELVKLKNCVIQPMKCKVCGSSIKIRDERLEQEAAEEESQSFQRLGKVCGWCQHYTTMYECEIISRVYNISMELNPWKNSCTNTYNHPIGIQFAKSDEFSDRVD
jgi:hypothetical protein